MDQVPLRDYLDRMHARLREGQYADVITLGQYVLRYYPKHIETYRLLAEASLETNDLVAAADLFERVRGADPENVIALVGLSIIHEQRKELEEAIWHLERAFDIQPANPELRKELLRLYAEFEGAPRDRLKLTPGGLARLYSRQGLYSQAIQEFRALLKRDPARTDIQAALAETLYRIGHKQEAAEIAQALLEQLPFCLKANLLLGALWSENGVPEAETLLQRAQSLDPEHKVARELLPDHWDDAPPPMLPAMPEEAPATPAVAAPRVKSEEGAGLDILSLESAQPALKPTTGVPPAPQAAAETAPQPALAAAVEPLVVAAPEPQVAPVTPVEAAVPQAPVAPIEEKLEPAQPQVEPVELGPAAAIPGEPTVEKLPPPESPAKVAAEKLAEPAAPAVETVEKLATPLAPAVEAAQKPEAPVAPSGEPVEKIGPSVAPVEPAAQPSVTPPPKPARRIEPSLPRIGPTIPGALEKLPAWVRGVTSLGARAEVSAPLAATATGETRLDALRMAQSDKARPTQAAAARPARTPTKPELPDSELPDWLTRARRVARSGDQEESSSSPSSAEERPAWLTEANAESPSTEAPTASPEWLRGDSISAPSDQVVAEGEGALPAWLATSEQEAQMEAPAAGSVLPEWLSSAKEEGEPTLGGVGAPVPSWLHPSEPEVPSETTAPGPTSSGEVKAPPQVEAQPAPNVPYVETPAWLAPSAAGPEVETDEEIPDWLREISAAEEAEPVAASPFLSGLTESVTPKISAAEVISSEPTAQARVEPAVPEVAPAAPVAVEPSAVPTAEVRVEPAAPDLAPAEPPPPEPVAVEAPAVPAAEVRVESTAPGPVAAEPPPPEPVAVQAPAGPPQAEEKQDTEADLQLTQAREVWRSGNPAGAIELYEKVLQAGPRLTPEVIADLEQFVQEPEAPMPAHRLLGDAYSVLGRFKEALEQYRIVLGK